MVEVGEEAGTLGEEEEGEVATEEMEEEEVMAEEGVTEEEEEEEEDTEEEGDMEEEIQEEAHTDKTRFNPTTKSTSPACQRNSQTTSLHSSSVRLESSRSTRRLESKRSGSTRTARLGPRRARPQ